MPNRNRIKKDFVCKFCDKKFKSVQHIQKFCNQKCYLANKPSPIDKFNKKVDKSGDCWIWNKGKASISGYGQICYKGRCIGAHRLSWILNNEEKSLESRVVE